MLDHLPGHSGVDLEEGGGGYAEVAATHAQRDAIVARHDNGMVFEGVNDRDAGLRLQLREIGAAGFENDHELLVLALADGDTLDACAGLKFELGPEGVGGRLRQM